VVRSSRGPVPRPPAAEHKKDAAHGFCTRIQRHRKATAFSSYPAPAAFPQKMKYPLYKKADGRYNKERNAPRIRLCMEVFAPYAGGGCW